MSDSASQPNEANDAAADRSTTVSSGPLRPEEPGYWTQVSDRHLAAQRASGWSMYSD